MNLILDYVEQKIFEEKRSYMLVFTTSNKILALICTNVYCEKISYGIIIDVNNML